MACNLTIAFDASCLATTQKTGVANFAARLLLALSQHYPEDIRLIGHYAGRQTPQQLGLPTAPNISYRRSRLVSARVLNMARRLGIWLPFELLTKTRADFHLFPAFIGWPSLFRTPSACIIHDLAYLEMPETVSTVNRHDLAKFVPIALRRAAFILTPSQATRDTLQKTYGTLVPPCIVTSIPPAPEIHLSQAEARAELRELGIPDDYLLFVGTLEPRKNITGLLETYTQLSDSLRQKHPLVLAGAPGWNSQEITAAIDQTHKSDLPVINTGYISDRQKAALYMRAHLLVQPSFYEGFGMPILEAMSYNLPVVASDIPVFHEVAGDAATYVNPHNPTALAKTLQRLLADPKAYTHLKEQSRQHFLRYRSWEYIATEVYDAVVNTARK